MTDQNGSMQLWNRVLSTKAESTRKNYKASFNAFLEFTGKTPDQLRLMKLKESQLKEPWMRVQCENLVKEYVAQLQKAGYAGSTIHLKLSGVKSFFQSQNMPLTMSKSDTPLIANEHASATPTREQVKSLIECARSLRDKALILFLKDSGLRVSDLEGLKWRDLTDYEGGFMCVQLVTVKTKGKATSFIGSECSRTLLLYKKQRLMGSRSVDPEQNIGDHPLFCPSVISGYFNNGLNPINSHAITQAVAYASKLAGFKIKITAHSLRKFWEQNIKVSRRAYAKQLNGRKLNAIEKAYFLKSQEQLFEIYKASYESLMIYTHAIKESDLDKIIEQRVSERMATQESKAEKALQLAQKQEKIIEGLFKLIENTVIAVPDNMTFKQKLEQMLHNIEK